VNAISIYNAGVVIVWITFVPTACAYDAIMRLSNANHVVEMVDPMYVILPGVATHALLMRINASVEHTSSFPCTPVVVSINKLKMKYAIFIFGVIIINLML
jgi:hypothetical protein